MSQIERLPVEILHRVCGYLDDVHNFALASKTCRSGAQAILYMEIRIYYSSPEALRTSVQQWMDRLRTAVSFHHVRSLVLKSARRGSLGDRDLWDPAAENLSARWQYSGDVSDRSMDVELDKQWEPVVELLDKLPGLGELHYACRPQLAPCLLQAIEDRTNCRLFLETFSLHSLIQPAGKPIRPSAYDLRLASSPCLHSIRSVRFNDLDDSGRQNFTAEAALTMASGVASQLKEVSLCYRIAGGSLAGYLAANIPPTEWQGDELGRKRSPRSKGALRSLELYGDYLCDVDNLRKWTNVTDFSKLTTLKLRDNVGVDMLECLIDQDLSSLQSLTLHIRLFRDRYEREEVDLEEVQGEADRLLVVLAAKLPMLHTLQITGECRHRTVCRMLAVQGMELQKLSLYTKFEAHGGSYDPIATAGGQWSCPALRELSTAVYRSTGDVDETRQYESLGANFPNVRRLSLLLECKDYGKEIEVDKKYLAEHPSLERMYNNKIYNLEHLLRNSAIDRKLSEAIFSRISSNKAPGSTRLERLELRVDHGGNNMRFPGGLWDMCRYVLGLNQVCTRNPWDGRMEVVVTNPPSTSQFNEDDVQARISERALGIFHSVWPERPGKSWRESWHSFPLAD